MPIQENPILGTSPVDFSFLSDLIKVEPTQSEINSSHERHCSTSIVNDIKKTNSYMVSESPVTSSLSSLTLEKESTSNESNENDPGETESSQSKYRRCSSLKSGKTPPGTPGRKRIVQ